MYTCTPKRAHTHTHTPPHVRAHTFAHTQMHSRACTQAHTHAHIHTNTHMHSHVYAHSYTCTLCSHACTHVHTHPHMHMRTPTHTHTCTHTVNECTTADASPSEGESLRAKAGLGRALDPISPFVFLLYAETSRRRSTSLLSHKGAASNPERPGGFEAGPPGRGPRKSGGSLTFQGNHNVLFSWMRGDTITGPGKPFPT